MATNTATGKTSPRRSLPSKFNHDTDLYNLTVKTSGGTEVIHATSNHLFWDLRQWIPAAELGKGEPLKTADGRTAVADGGTTPQDHGGWMWDLTVPGNNDHDFYVVSAQTGNSSGMYRMIEVGNTPVLVHNCIISNETLNHIKRAHTPGGDLNDGTKTTWTIRPGERRRAIDEVLDQDPNGAPNTGDRSGTVHHGTISETAGIRSVEWKSF